VIADRFLLDAIVTVRARVTLTGGFSWIDSSWNTVHLELIIVFEAVPFVFRIVFFSRTMSGFFDHQFDGNERRANVNLSTSASTSSTALLSSVRAERKAREDRRRHEVAAMTIQRVWRGRREAQEVREQLLKRLEEGLMDWQKDAAGLVVVVPRGWVDGPIEDVKRKRQVLVRWCERGLRE
jgi:hypothetical protein